MDENAKIINYSIVNLNTQLNRNAGYLARQEIEKLLSNISNSPRRLEHFGFKVYSQNDEDGIIEEIFKRLGISRGIFCEIGIENGLECNSLYLLHKGWKGFWIEGNSKHRNFIETKFDSVLKNKKLVLCIDYVHPANVNSLISSKLAPILSINSTEIDFLSIDIDGMDIYLLEAINFNPKVICIEYNSKFPANVYKKPTYSSAYSWKGTDYMGSSLLALNEVATIKGYTLIGTNIVGANAFFVRNDLVGENFLSLPIEEFYNPPRYYLYFDHFANVGHKADFGLYSDLISDTKTLFTNVYQNKLWGKSANYDEEFFSGSGSHNNLFVDSYINCVSIFLKSFKQKPNVVDLGCGDFNIGSQLRNLCENYIACDIVDSLIEFNKIKFKDSNVDFRALDISNDRIPKGEVAFIRQVLQHLTNDQIIPLLSKLKNDFNYLILTEHIPLISDFIPNLDMLTSEHIRLSINSGVVLTRPPFNLDVMKSEILCEVEERGGLIQTILYKLN